MASSFPDLDGSEVIAIIKDGLYLETSIQDIADFVLSQGGGTVSLGLLSIPTMGMTGAALAISGATAGSTITTTASGVTLNSAARTITFSSAGAKSVDLTQTLAGAVNSPRTNTVTTTISGTTTLGDLSLPATGTAGVALSITGATAGSALTSADLPSGATLNSSARTLTLSSAGTFSFHIVETLAGATGSPKSTALSTTISSAGASLQPLTVPSQAAQGNTVFISNATPGSTISISNLPVGVTLDSINRRLTFSQVGSFSFSMVETLAGSPNSPRTTPVSVTITALTQLPRQSDMILNFRADAITGATDNTTFTAWNDPISGTTTTLQKGAPKYRTAGFAGKPTVRFDGVSSLNMGRPNSFTSPIDAKTGVTYAVVVANTDSATGTYNGPFGNNFDQGWVLANGVQMGAIGFNAGYPTTIPGLAVIICRGGPDVGLGGSQFLPRTMVNGTILGTSGGIAQNSSTYDYHIGDSAGGWGVATGNSNCYKGDILAVQAWNRQLTNAEMILVTRHWFDQCAVTYPWTGLTRFPLFFGDSITDGVAADSNAHNMPALVASNLGLTLGQYSNIGRASATIQAIGNYVASETGGLKDALGIPVCVVYNEWTNSQQHPNDLNISPNGSIVLTDSILATMKTNEPTQKTLFWTPVDVGVLGSNPIVESSYEDGRQAFIAHYYPTPPGSIDAVAPIHLNAHVGATGSVVASDRDTWWGDAIHPKGNSGTCGYSEMANIISPILNTLLAS